MNTWMVGYHPIGHHVHNNRQSKIDKENGNKSLGEKTFFMKSRIMAGQADLTRNTQGLKDFKWLTKDEIPKFVQQKYWSHIQDMLAGR